MHEFYVPWVIASYQSSTTESSYYYEAVETKASDFLLLFLDDTLFWNINSWLLDSKTQLRILLRLIHMGLHMVALVKLHWQLSSHSLKPAVTGFAYPVVLKFLMGFFRLFREEALYQSRLFLFRLTQIVFNRELPLSNSARLERALRLIRRLFVTAISSGDLEIGHDTFHELSLIAL